MTTPGSLHELGKIYQHSFAYKIIKLIKRTLCFIIGTEISIGMDDGCNFLGGGERETLWLFRVATLVDHARTCTCAANTTELNDPGHIIHIHKSRSFLLWSLICSSIVGRGFTYGGVTRVRMHSRTEADGRRECVVCRGQVHGRFPRS